MYILAVDPGLVEWAYAVFDEDGDLIMSKMVKYESKRKLTQEQRLFFIFDELTKLDYEFTCVIIERQFVDTMQQITGVLRAYAGNCNLKTVLFTPSQWRKLATGKGNASEELVVQTVLAKYPQMDELSVHEKDCAAIYIAYRAREQK